MALIDYLHDKLKSSVHIGLAIQVINTLSQLSCLHVPFLVSGIIVQASFRSCAYVSSFVWRAWDVSSSIANLTSYLSPRMPSLSWELGTTLSKTGLSVPVQDDYVHICVDKLGFCVNDSSP